MLKKQADESWKIAYDMWSQPAPLEGLSRFRSRNPNLPRGLIAAGHSIEWLMSHDRAVDPRPGPLERSYALQWASHGLQVYLKELRRESERAREESRRLRAELALLLSR